MLVVLTLIGSGSGAVLAAGPRLLQPAAPRRGSFEGDAAAQRAQKRGRLRTQHSAGDKLLAAREARAPVNAILVR